MIGGALVTIVAAVALATALAGLLARRSSIALGSAALGVALIGVSIAAQPFPSPGQSSASVAAAPFVTPLCLVLVVPRSRYFILSVALSMVGALVAGPMRVAATDPLRDATCQVQCWSNPFGLTSAPGTAHLFVLVGTTLIAAAIALAAWRLRSDWWRVAALVLAALAALLSTPTQRVLLLAAAAAACALAGFDIAATMVARRRVDELVEALRSPNDDVAAWLAERLGDPLLRVYHLVPSRGAYVDHSGSPEPDVQLDERVTDLVSAGVVVTRVHHSVDASDIGELAQALDTGARLGIENDRLSADVATRAADLAESRRRIVDRADSERRALEHDVHDSAQQHVLALGLELQVAAAMLAADDPRRVIVDQCVSLTEFALDELRTLGHGIYPAQLEAGGFVHALRALSRRSDGRVDIVDPHVVERMVLTAEVARAMYAVASDAVSRSAITLQMMVEPDGNEAKVHLRGTAGSPGAVIPDRVATVGGTMWVEGETWEVVVPCGWS